MFQSLQLLLYVEDPAKSAAFYSGLVGRPAQSLSPFFAVVPWSAEVSLAFWARSKAPAGWTTTGESGEVCLVVESPAALRELHDAWVKQGVRVLQPPEKMYFGGHNLIAADLDGHRIRVSTPD